MPRNLVEMTYLNQLTGGYGLVWLQVAMLVCLFVVLLFRPERIRSPLLLTWAGALLACSVIVPPVVWHGIQVLISDARPIYSTTRPIRGGDMTMLLFANLLQSASGPVLLGSGVLCAVFALRPRAADTARDEPPRHPLE